MKKRPGSKKRSKTKSLRIDVEKIIHPEELPPDAKFEGHRGFIVQDIVIKSQNTGYRRAVYRRADGSLIVGQLPDGVDSHFGPALIEFILVQTHQNHVTQGRLLEQLTELEVDISAGKLSGILLDHHENFQAYLRARIRGRGGIPLLADLMRKTAAEREVAPASQ